MKKPSKSSILVAKPDTLQPSEQPRQLEKALTGIDGFDEITLGGLPRGRASLMCGSAGCGKTLFATEFLVNGARKYTSLAC